MTIIAIDTETAEKQPDGSYKPTLNAQKGILACLIEEGKKKPKYFNLEKQPESLYQYILKKTEIEAKRKKTIEIWSLNHQYDFSVYAKGHYYDENIKPISYNPFIHILTTKQGGEARLLDIGNFYNKKTLAEIGQLIGTPKTKMPEKFWNINDIKQYCYNDTLIAIQSIQKLKQALKELGWSIKRFTTAPRLAMTIFQNELSKKEITKNDGRTVKAYGYWFNKGKIHQTKQPEYLRMACRGARIEMFGQPDKTYKNTYKVDINSCYPYICSINEFPDLIKEKLITEPTIQDLNEIGISEVTIKAPNKPIGYLPIRYKKVIYPTNCTLKGFWTNHEIKQAIKEGYILEDIHTTINYKPLPFNPFKDIFEKLYKIKNEPNNMLRYTAKLLMNSLTGKFAYQKQDKETKKINRTELYKHLGQGYTPVTPIHGTPDIIIEKVHAKKYANTSHPAIYAMIMAYARDYLYQHMKLIQPEDLLYVATDAIIFKGEHNLKHFNIGTQMGQWKLEKNNVESEFWNEDWYKIDNEIKSSGARKIDVTIEAIKGIKPLTTLNMTSLKQAKKQGKPELAGTFYNKTMNITRSPKRQIQYPPYIEEIPPSRLIKFEDIIKDETFI